MQRVRDFLLAAALLSALCSLCVSFLIPEPEPTRSGWMDAVAWSANRLVQLQNADGGWPVGSEGPSVASSYGVGGRALLWAWNATGSSHHLDSARKAADGLLARLAEEPSAAQALNGVFLVEMSLVTGEERYMRAARWIHETRLRTGRAGIAEPGSVPPPGGWDESSWRQLQVWRALDDVELALVLGEEETARELTGQALHGVALDPDIPGGALATARAVEVLARLPRDPYGARATLALATLREVQVGPGLLGPDSSAPYLYAQDAAQGIRTFLVSGDPQLVAAAESGCLFLADRQFHLGTGGWGDVIPLQGYEEDARGIEEQPGITADVLMALSQGLRSSLRPVS